ncbi:hypothetical protein GKD50_02135 [Parabacteroides distasonis]|uniref:Uncharacterized protein n=2 Tax=Bacteroidales TaxID=171549 RepID=A0A9Q4QVP9_PARDI|nr:hypothetical protein [Parabacteroides distasonis]MRY80109.1 hypothetical protein [Parabacteroides distasonis]MRZ21319.1 hypothetical protein [Parabacteroides distasonis]MRZ74765.1 hypothetical protein [Parabacteroides distasonis]MRZ98088.1 hypothetical protein [Parabacteroides distasonis]
MTHYSLEPCFAIRTRLSHFRAWLRTSNVAASGFGFGRDCNGFTDYRHFNQNPCNSILSLYLSAFHFFVVTLLYNNPTRHKCTSLHPLSYS